MYVVVVNFHVKPECAEEFRVLVAAQAENSLNRESGCHCFDVAFAPDDPTRCLLYEHYDDRAAFDEHLKTDHFREFSVKVEHRVVSKEVTYWELAP
jgi:quinol monooxygenase YgiN